MVPWQPVSSPTLLAAASEAVDVARDLIRSRRPTVIEAKGDRDLVTDVDRDVERRVRDLLTRRTPGIDVLGEEKGLGPGEGGASRYWALDPVDGTVNYAAGSPLCAMALALVEDGQPVLGVIDLPFLGSRYWATSGGGAFRNGEGIRTADVGGLGQAIVALGDFATGPGARAQNELQLRLAGWLAGRVLRVRMLGSAAIDLAWLADGRHHASITLTNRPWDMAAGAVIAREAGASVRDLEGAAYSTSSATVVAAAPGIAERIVAASFLQ